MADGTKIEWTDATWNPITGCAVVSPGCTNCYAMKLAGTRLQHHPSRAGLTQPSKSGPVWNGKVRFNQDWLDQPLRWKRPRMIFVCAHGDLFAENVPDEWIDKVFAVMAIAPQHTFQVLTKRPERMREYVGALLLKKRSVFSAAFAVTGSGKTKTIAEAFSRAEETTPEDIDRRWIPLPNVWLGVSVEDQERADERIPILLDTPAAVRWISAEPLLGPIDLSEFVICPNARNGLFMDPDTGAYECCKSCEGTGLTGGLDWVVAGGESGQGARPMHPDWVRSLRDQCADAGVAFHFKQWGEWSPIHLVFGEPGMDDDSAAPIDGCCDQPAAHTAEQECFFLQDKHWVHWPQVDTREAIGVRRIGKAAAGRTLDGITHDAYPARDSG
jgi:protein gp37